MARKDKDHMEGLLESAYEDIDECTPRQWDENYDSRGDAMNGLRRANLSI